MSSLCFVSLHSVRYMSLLGCLGQLCKKLHMSHAQTAKGKCNLRSLQRSREARSETCAVCSVARRDQEQGGPCPPAARAGWDSGGRPAAPSALLGACALCGSCAPGCPHGNRHRNFFSSFRKSFFL